MLSVWGEKYCEYYGSTTTARSFAMISSSILFVLPLCYSKRIDFLRYVRWEWHYHSFSINPINYNSRSFLPSSTLMSNVFFMAFSSIGVIAVLYVVFLIAYQYWMGNFVPGPIKTAPNSWTDVFLVVPAICFGYQVKIIIILFNSLLFSICMI